MCRYYSFPLPQVRLLIQSLLTPLFARAFYQFELDTRQSQIFLEFHQAVPSSLFLKSQAKVVVS